MTTTLELDLPDTAFSALRVSPKEFVRELKLAATVKWFEAGMISQSKAAEIAGTSRAEFIQALSRLGVSPVQETPEDLRSSLSRL
ncbi:MAG: UPF0175 family protein [Prosthecobacter sp.]|uniref:UPF0175 family protein n=1 Tax=Prosthecobacter sp. TaxID=1965333 RepID=UPI0019E40A72|nr:UPF0175 family protein [Prosthecobacter sp.]MBE2282672.1 UPF0175 family protein [Prosthecobacter sp.]